MIYEFLKFLMYILLNLFFFFVKAFVFMPIYYFIPYIRITYSLSLSVFISILAIRLWKCLFLYLNPRLVTGLLIKDPLFGLGGIFFPVA